MINQINRTSVTKKKNPEATEQSNNFQTSVNKSPCSSSNATPIPHLRLWLLGFLIPFAPPAFFSQCQHWPCRMLLPSVFFPSSVYFNPKQPINILAMKTGGWFKIKTRSYRTGPNHKQLIESASARTNGHEEINCTSLSFEFSAGSITQNLCSLHVVARSRTSYFF